MIFEKIKIMDKKAYLYGSFDFHGIKIKEIDPDCLSINPLN